MAVVAALVGLAATNSRSSSSCETDGSAQSEAAAAIGSERGSDSIGSGATAAPGPNTEVGCDPADAMTTITASPAEAIGEATSTTSEPDHAEAHHVVAVPAEGTSTAPPPVDAAPADSDSVELAPADPDSTPAAPDPGAPAPAVPDPTPVDANPAPTPAPAEPAPAPAPAPDPRPASYDDITVFGVFHGTSSHTHGESLAGGRTPITTEALVAYNGLRVFAGLDAVELEAIGRWAFANNLTNNGEAYAQELTGVGLYYGMQGAKVGWIRDDAFDPQILADIQRAARQGDTSAVMAMVEAFGHAGYDDHLARSGLVDAFVNTLKMEPHYGGWMHGRVHGGLPFSDGAGASVASAHDLNHLTVLSHDQTEPFMNDTFDWPQWPALEVPEPDVIDYFQSMVVLSDPRGDTQL